MAAQHPLVPTSVPSPHFGRLAIGAAGYPWPQLPSPVVARSLLPRPIRAMMSPSVRPYRLSGGSVPPPASRFPGLPSREAPFGAAREWP